MDRSTIASKYPYMMNYLNTTNFDCVNLAGLRLLRSNFGRQSIAIGTDVPSIGFLKTITKEEVVNGADPTVFRA